MAQDKLTAKQQEILEYIKNTILKKGYPPAVRDICEAVKLKSTSSVHSHLSALEEKGYIHRDPTKPRAIEILDDTFNFNRKEMVNIRLQPENRSLQRNISKVIFRSRQSLFQTQRPLCFM